MKNVFLTYDSLSFLEDSYILVSTEIGMYYVKVLKSKKKYIKVEDFLTSHTSQFLVFRN